MSREDKAYIRRVSTVAVLPFIAMVVALSMGWIAPSSRQPDMRVVIAVVVAIAWFVPHIAVLIAAWRHDGEINFGPLGKHAGPLKQSTLLLLFILETILLPLAVALGSGGWH